MKEIKFRGKRINDKEWVFGYLVKTKNSTYICYDGQYDDDLFLSPKNILIPVDPATVGQFAGEIQGQQVHEGDVIEFTDSFYGDFDKRTEKTVRGYVVRENHYVHNFPCFMIHVPQKTPFRVLQNISPWSRRKGVRIYHHTHHCALKDNSKFRVIGNIYDNPDLLEGGKADAD